MNFVFLSFLVKMPRQGQNDCINKKNKKKTPLRQYMKHADNKCKICDNVFTNSMDALVHTAKDHSQNLTKDNSNINLQLEKVNETPEVKETIDKATKQKQLELSPAARTALHLVCGCEK